MSTREVDDEFMREVGAAVIGWIAATRKGRWAGPAGALVYVQVKEGTTEALVRDFVAWAGGWPSDDERQRMEAFADEIIAVESAALESGAA